MFTLLHNLAPEQQPDSVKQLISLLAQSDIDTDEMNLFQNESKTLIDKNLFQKQSLLNDISTSTVNTDKKYKVYRRETPFISSRVSASSPSWARGAKPEFTIGPLSGVDGRNFWFDFYFYEKLIPVYISGDTSPIMLVPLSLFIFQLNTNTYKVAEGSIWLRADLFAIGLASNQYAGLNINSGTLNLSSSHPIINNILTIAATESFNISLELNNTFAATGSSNFGIDARNSVINLPSSIELQFASGKFNVAQLSDSNWTLYGDQRNFSWQQGGAITFNTFLNRLVFPLNTDKPEFEITDCESEFFNIEQKASVISSGWCLSVAVISDITKPFAVAGNGALSILCGNGLFYQWKGLDKLYGVVKMNIPLVMAEPGKFSVADAFSLFNQHTELYQLWKRDIASNIRTTAELFFKNNKPFIYYSDQSGFESITTTADVNFKTDKPYRADGESVSPNTIDSLYIKYVSDTIKNILIYDQDMLLQATPSFNHLQKPEIYQFAITNAYMITTPPASLLLAGAFDDNNVLTKANLTIVYGLFILNPILPHPYTANNRLTNEINVEQLKNIDAVSEWLSLLSNYVMSTCIWDDANIIDDATVNVDFDLLTDLFRSLTDQSTGTDVTNQAIEQFFEEEIIEEYSLMSGIGDKDVYGRNLFSLLDLSTNYDLFGVSMVWNNQRYRFLKQGNASVISSGVVTIEKMNLQTPMLLLNAFTLPNVSWEPLNNLADEGVLPLDPPKGILSFPDNGPPSIFTQFDINPVDIDPLKHLERFKNNLSAGAKNPGTFIIFGLPHGKVSLAILKYFSETYATVKGNLDFIRPEFKPSTTTVKGGLQFRITSSTESGRPQLPGMTNQLENVADINGNLIGKSILGDSVHNIFLNDFYRNADTKVPEMKADGVPVILTDFSGYGANMYSDWHNPDAQIAQTSEVRFDVLIGRVSHEVVQVVSILYPWGIKVVRTITFHRNGNAVIYREDSGWVAQSDGLFDFSFKGRDAGNNPVSFDNPFAFHPGLISGLFNVHNIKELNEPPVTIDHTLQNGDYYFNTSGKFIKQLSAGDAEIGTPQPGLLRAVTFDADIAIENISAGASNGRVTGKSIKGYLQIQPQGVPITPGMLKELFNRQQNSIGGSVDCTMKIGGSEQLMKVNRIDVAASYQNDNNNDIIFVVAAKGSVQLPSEGSWSVVEVDKGSGNVTPVTNKLSVPVIRKGERDRKKDFILNGNDNIARIAFPDSLVNNVSYNIRYGYVQNTGTQKLLLTDPHIDQFANTQLKSETPLLADAYRLLNSKGPFPNLNNVIPVESGAQAVTDIISSGLKKAISGFEVPDDLSFDIIGKDGDTLHLYVKYASDPSSGGTTKTLINYVTDSSSVGDKWKNNLGNLSIVADLGPFKELITITGDFNSNNSIEPGFDSGNAPQLKLCKELEPIYEILEFLDNLDATTNPVEAIKKGLKIAMSNTADSWEYKFKAEKEIPLVKFPFDVIDYNSPTTPLKLDAYFKVGCYYNQPLTISNSVDQLTPSSGTYLELGADLRVMCFSLAAATVYATGRAQVGLAADLKTGPNLYFKFGFGIELCVGLPVIGDVSVMYLVGVDMKLNTQALTVGAFIYFRGRAEIFAGIVTITIQIEAAGKIEKQFSGPTSCIAMCTFALDISIFLVIDINFTETWEETRQIA